MNRIYNAKYYENYDFASEEGQGSMYSNKEKLYPFFEQIADNIIANYAPRTVLDVGCAYGYLVEALRKKGVEAYGIDVSEYAISQVDESIQPYVFVNSAEKELPVQMPKRYDLIISIEVMEHLTLEAGEKALQYLCSLTDTFVFSSTDSEISDITHINVQRKEYWAKVFAKQGFFRDVQQRPTYIAECADTYRKRNDICDVIQEYEVAYRIASAVFDRPTRSTTGLIYYDAEKDFCEENKIIIEKATIEDEIKVEVDITEYSNHIRFDPAQFACILSDVIVELDGQTRNAMPVNGEVLKEYWIFAASPQILIPVNGKGKLKITGKILRVNDTNLPADILLELIDYARTTQEKNQVATIIEQIRLQKEDIGVQFQKLSLESQDSYKNQFDAFVNDIKNQQKQSEVIFKEYVSDSLGIERNFFQKIANEMQEMLGLVQSDEKAIQEQFQEKFAEEKDHIENQTNILLNEIKQTQLSEEKLQIQFAEERENQKQQTETLINEIRGEQEYFKSVFQEQMLLSFEKERGLLQEQINKLQKELEQTKLEEEKLQEQFVKEREYLSQTLEEKQEQFIKEREQLNQTIEEQQALLQLKITGLQEKLEQAKLDEEKLQKQFAEEREQLNQNLEEQQELLQIKIEELQAELAYAQNVCQIYENAFFWKITKPFRVFTDFIKGLYGKLFPENRSSLLKKGIHSLQDNGVKSTYKKVCSFVKRRKNLQVLSDIVKIDEDVRIQQEGTEFSKKICFSILVPLYNTPLQYLEEMIQSVTSQTYSNWQLCLADGSDDEHKEVGRYCKSLQKNDPRICYRKLKKNGGISENTNACIDMATGDYIGLFDHDDVLHPSALYEMICVIEKENADFLYTDEVVFEGELSNITTAHFKPDYALDTLRANNYICHFTVFKKALLEQAGRFRSECDGSQDHDLILRLTNVAEKIYHIPKALYFWRSHASSVASDISAKPYVGAAGRKAVKDSLEALGISATVESSEAFPAIYRLKYEIIGSPLVSIIISCKNSLEEIRKCVKSIVANSTYQQYEIILAPESSVEEKIYKRYKDFKNKYNGRVKTILPRKDLNYAALNNCAVQQAKGEYIVFLHSDTEVITPGWIEELLMYAQRSDVGAVGAKLYYENNSICHAGMILGMGADGVVGYVHQGIEKENLGYMGRLSYAQNISMVSSSCMMVAKDIFLTVGGFYEEYRMQYADADFCMRLRSKGYLNVWNPYAELYHYSNEKLSIKKNHYEIQDDITIFKEIWKTDIEKGDPYFNLNFKLDDVNFEVKEKNERIEM